MIPRKSHIGDPIDFSARTQGQFVEAVQGLRDEQFAHPVPTYPMNIPKHGTVVKVVNRTDPPVCIPQHGVVELGSSRHIPYIDEDSFKNQILFEGVAPSEQWEYYPTNGYEPGVRMRRTLGIAQKPIEPGHVGNVLIQGVTQARIDTDALWPSLPGEPVDESQWWWSTNGMCLTAVPDDVSKLRLCPTGPFELLWMDWRNVSETSELVTWGIVRFTPPHRAGAIDGHAIAIYDWDENGTYPNGNPRVEVRMCDPDGSNPNLDSSFYLYCPRKKNGNNAKADPAIYVDDVVRWRWDEDGVPRVKSEYLNRGKIGDIMMVANDTYIPEGWAKCDGSVKTNANYPGGSITLHNFVYNFEGTNFGCIPRYPHIGVPEASGDRLIERNFDAAGDAGGRLQADAVPAGGGYARCSDNAGNPIDGVNRAAYRAAGAAHDVPVWLWLDVDEQFEIAVWFIERWK